MLVVAALMIVAHTAFRAWALSRSWFYTDDYDLLMDAEGAPLSADHLAEPFHSNFMPGGRLLVWLVARSGTLNWDLAATSTVVLQLVAATSCLVMLACLFGVRLAILAPLAVYLTTALTLPGYMWWAAALNQLPLQIALFLAVAAWVQYLRSGRLRWVLAVIAVTAFGVAFFVKAMLVLPVLVVLLLGYFSTGTVVDRVRGSLRRHWLAALVVGVPAAAFAAYYALAVPQPFESGDRGVGLAAEVADSMLGTALPVALLGGPWRWWETTPPIVLAGPPAFAVHLSWVVIALVVLFALLRRRRTGRAWILLAAYALVAFVLLATSRGQVYGRLAGLEYRYLTDVAPVAVLALGLAFLPLRGAAESSEPRDTPLLAWSPRPALTAGLVGAVCLGGVISSVQYVGFWHHGNASATYVANVLSGLRQSGQADLAPQPVPSTVMPEYTGRNRTEVFLPLFTDRARFPEATDDLRMLDEQGALRPATISGGYAGLPGRTPGCGWAVRDSPVLIPLDGETFDFGWWAKIGYLASSPATLQVRAGGSVREVPVRRGLGSAWVQLDGVFDRVTLELEDSDGSGATVCVDSVAVGLPQPGDEG